LGLYIDVIDGSVSDAPTCHPGFPIHVLQDTCRFNAGKRVEARRPSFAVVRGHESLKS
jgi:hypothetical protein